MTTDEFFFFALLQSNGRQDKAMLLRHDAAQRAEIDRLTADVDALRKQLEDATDRLNVLEPELTAGRRHCEGRTMNEPLTREQVRVEIVGLYSAVGGEQARRAGHALMDTDAALRRQLAEARRAAWEEAANSVETLVCKNDCSHDVCFARRYDANKLRPEAKKEPV